MGKSQNERRVSEVPVLVKILKENSYFKSLNISDHEFTQLCGEF
jgi:hypothetical protein